MSSGNTYDEILNFMQVTNKQLTKIIEHSEVQMSDKKTVTIIDLNGDKEKINITKDGSISNEGGWIVVYYDEDVAVAGFKSSNVKSWWISL